MTVVITDVDAFTDPILAPADGEPVNSAGIIAAPIQLLSNRTRYLANILDAVGAGLADRELRMPGARAHPDGTGGGVPDWTIDSTTANSSDILTNNGVAGGRAVFWMTPGVDMPRVVVVTGIQVTVTPANARSSPNLMELTWVTINNTGTVVVSSAVEDDTTAAKQIIDSGTISITLKAEPAAGADLVMLGVVIKGGNDAPDNDGDMIHRLTVFYDVTKI